MKKIYFFHKKSNCELEEYLMQKEEKRKIRAKHRIIRKANKTEEKEKICDIKKKQQWFHFFTKWFFFGIILVVISFCISLCEDKITGLLKNILPIISAVTSTIGVSLFVGCVFDFSKNSMFFTQFRKSMEFSIL